MRQKAEQNPFKNFVFAIAVTAILFCFDQYVGNRVSTNEARVVSGVIFGLFALPLFVIGTKNSIEAKQSIWVALNIVCIVLIIGWTILLSLILYAFKDFQLVIPA